MLPHADADRTKRLIHTAARILKKYMGMMTLNFALAVLIVGVSAAGIYKMDNLEKYIEGRWYWVSNGEYSWIAKRDNLSVGGWTNEDTWEDFDRKVVKAEIIPLPSWEAPPQTGGFFFIGPEAVEVGRAIKAYMKKAPIKEPTND